MPTHHAIKQAVAKGAVLTSEMEVFFEICPCKTIAVTGSDGKTTTTSIIAEILKNDGKTVHLGGNIGTPLLSRADDMELDDIAVVELSSFQLITMQKSPNIAVVTNLSPNHLDVHGDMDEYVEAKSNIFRHQKRADRVVLNMDNRITRDYANQAPSGEVLYFSMREKVINGVYLDDGVIYGSVNGEVNAIMKSNDIIIPGEHNIENYLAACAAVSGIAGYASIRDTARGFRGVEHRLELVRELNGVKYYNDSIASSPSRAIAGIRALTANGCKNEVKESKGSKGSLVLIAGGKDKGIPFDDFGAEIIKRVNTVVLTGGAAGMIRLAVEGALKDTSPDRADRLNIIRCDDFDDAVIVASKAAKDGDIVLLSPACTSFDKFNNFEERGGRFKDIVNRLA